MALVLASASPRRHQLLTLLGVDFVVRPAELDETPHAGERPRPYVQRLARAKAMAVLPSGGDLAFPDDIIVAADTTVDLDGQILAKPVDRADARRMLRALSGRTHAVHTGLALAHRGAVDTVVVTSEVAMVELSDADIDWYLTSGEADDKAGAYALQGRAARFVRQVSGSVSNIIGLPMYELFELAKRNGVDLLAG